MTLMLSVDARGRRVVVVGAGAAGGEKVERLLAAGAVVVVVDPAALPDACDDVRRRPFERPDVDGAWMVIAATGDRAVDDEVARAAAEVGALLVRADRADGGGLAFAATIERGPITVGIGTGGASPAFARWLRDRIAATLTGSVVELASLLARRPRHDGRRRHAGLPFDDLLSALDAGDVEGAQLLLADPPTGLARE